MLKRVKRGAALWMALCLAVTAVPVTAWADQENPAETENELKQAARAEAESGEENSVTWELSPEGVLTIRGNGEVWYDGWEREQVTSVVVEAGITGIGDDVFSSCSGLVSVKLPEGLTSIGSNAFYNCASLAEVALPEGLTSIGNCAFYNCANLASVTIPASVESVEWGAFGYDHYEDPDNNANKLKTAGPSGGGYDVEFGWDREIPEQAFSDCASLTEVTLPEGMESIGSNAFSGCTGLESVTLSKSLTSIGDSAFSNCASLTGVEIPEGVESIGSNAFYECASLAEAVLPEGLASIGDQAFFGCVSLARIQLPKSLTSIGYSVFSNCASLAEVALPEGLTTIKSGTFSGCTGLASVEIPEGVTAIEGGAFSECTGLAGIRLPKSLTSIGGSAFSGCSGLAGVEIPEGVTAIEENTFFGCAGLAEITLPGSLERIEYFAFYNCASLVSVTLPEGLTHIGNYAFCNCVSLAGVTIPASVESVEWGAFGCDKESDNNGNKLKTAGPSGGGYDVEFGWEREIPEYAFSGCAGLTEVTLPEGMESIGSNAFSGCTGLESVTLPKSLTSIGLSAFYDCESLAGVEIPEGVTAIEDETFRGCRGLVTAQLPASLESIGYSAFCNCESLAGVTLPEGLTSIGNCAFYNCASLAGVTIPASVESVDWGAFGNENKLRTAGPSGGGYDLEFGWDREIPEQAFSDCVGLTEVTLPEGLTGIGSHAFYGCRGLAGIRLPGSLTSIGSYAFSECGDLVSVEIPEGVTAIEDGAFSGCRGLLVVQLPASLTSIGYDAFWDCQDLKLCVIFGSYGETYARENNIPFEMVTTNSKIVRISVTEEDGTSVTSGFRVKWYADGRQIGSGKAVSVTDAVESLTYRVELSESDMFTYYQPKEQAVDLESGERSIVCACKLKRIPSVTLSGKVVDSAGNAVPGALILLTQMADSDHVRTEEFQTDESGAYFAEILDLPTTAQFCADGYYQRTVTAISEPAGSGVNLETVTLSKLPENKITLRLSMEKATAEGEDAPVVSLANGNGLEFAVYNETKGRAVSEYSVQYPYLILGESEADGNDTLTISVTDTKRKMTALPVQITLDLQKMGTAEIVFVQNGSLEASLQEELPAVLMLFDENGNFVAKKTAEADTVSSEELPEGAYQTVFMQKTNYLESAPQLSKLSGYGLVEGKDYVLKHVTIQNGIITRLGSVKVPKLDESLLYYTDGAGTSMTANKQSVTVGDYVMLRAEYKMKPEYAGAADQSVAIEIPKGAQFVENSVTVDGKAVNYTYGDRVVTARTDKNSGIVRCYVILEESGEKDINAELSFTWDGAGKTQPLGAAHIAGELMRLTVPERTGRKNVTITGKAMAGSGITVYDNGIEAGKAQANAAGNWSLSFDLARPFYYTYHDICAAVENEKYDNILYSDTHTVVYDQNYMDVSKVTMYNTGDNGENITVFDFLNPGKQGSYRMWPGHYTDFTFVIEFTGVASQAEDVVLNVISKSGQTSAYDAEYDAVKDAWIVNTNFYTYNDAPVNVGVEYSQKEGNGEYSATSHPDAAQCNRESIAAMDEMLEDVVDVKIKEDTDEKLVLAFSPAGSEEEAWSMEMRELDYEFFDIGKLESQGFIKCEADQAGEKPQYIKMDVEETRVVFSIVDEEERDAFSFTVPVDFTISAEKEAQGISLLSARMIDWKGMEDCAEGLRRLLDLMEDSAPEGSGELIAAMDYQVLRRMLEENNIYFMNRASDIQKLMARECEDGSLSLPPEIWKEAQKRYGDVVAADAATYSWLKSDLEVYQKKIWTSLVFTVETLGFGKILKVGGGIGKTFMILKNSKNAKYTKYVIRSKKVRDNLDDWLEAAWDGLNDIGGDYGEYIGGPFGEFFDAIDTSGSQYWEDIREGYEKLDALYDGLENYIRSNMRCKPKEEPKSDGKKGPDTDKTPILDPSGYVCEAVPSNRLEGVTATLYGLRDQTDSFGEPTGEKEEYLWNAEDYDQTNPLLTDASGVYMWDVPEGQWRVKYEKEGYETAYSDWLPVPPPQTDVHAALASLAAPQVETVNVYRDNIKITFTQYMDMESVNTDNIKAAIDGQEVSGSIEACDAEASFADETVSYARTFMFTPDQEISGEADVTVKDAANYAGTRMEEPYSVRKKAVEEPKSIEAEDYVEIGYHAKGKIQVQVLPKEAAAGLSVTVKSSSPSILSAEEDSIKLDADGKADVTLSGNLPGGGEILLAVDGTDIEKKIKVRVQTQKSPEGQKKQCGKVSASIAGGSAVPKGTKVALSVETEGADIYYTLDGTCPCATNSPSRMKYTAPVEITGDTLLIAYAVKDGYEDGVTSAFSYTVKESQDAPHDPGKTDPGMKDTESFSKTDGQENRLKKGAQFTGKDKTLSYKVIKESSKNTPGTASVVGAAKKKSKISIPSVVTAASTGESFYVISVAPKAFKGNGKVTRVTVGDKVETIGGSAFSGCKKLNNVTLGKNVSKIGDKAFYQCAKLKKITIKSKKLKKVGKNAIYGIAKNAVVKVPAKQRKAYDKKLNKKTGRKSTMKVVK